jgi:hypothetical protein
MMCCDCAQWLVSVLFCTVYADVGMHTEREFTNSLIVKRFGGREGIRTPDPLLAKRASRFQQPRWYLLTASVYNKSGNLLSLKS